MFAPGKTCLPPIWYELIGFVICPCMKSIPATSSPDEWINHSRKIDGCTIFSYNLTDWQKDSSRYEHWYFHKLCLTQEMKKKKESKIWLQLLYVVLPLNSLVHVNIPTHFQAGPIGEFTKKSTETNSVIPLYKNYKHTNNFHIASYDKVWIEFIVITWTWYSVASASDCNGLLIKWGVL